MIISNRLTQQIVEQLSDIIKRDINFIDLDGTILHSTDKKRIGTIHEGAKVIIEKKLTDLVIEKDNEYEGSRNGINLPIMFENEVVGVIGITGESQEVSKYGEIIKKMTEILIKEHNAQEQDTILQKAHDRFLEEWVLDRLDERDPELFAQRKELSSIKTDLLKRVIVIGINKDSLLPDDNKLTVISKKLRHMIKNEYDGELFRTISRYVIILPKTDDDTIWEIVNKIYKNFFKVNGIKIACGVNPIENEDIHVAYQKADKAMTTGKKRSALLSFYSNLDPVQYFVQIPQTAKSNYISNMFPEDKFTNLEYWMEFIRTYIEDNGSLQLIAKDMNMHKNTVQYKLNYLADNTGYDLRKLRDFRYYIMALDIWNNH